MPSNAPIAVKEFNQMIRFVPVVAKDYEWAKMITTGASSKTESNNVREVKNNRAHALDCF